MLFRCKNCGHPTEVANGCVLAEGICPACYKPLSLDMQARKVGGYELLQKLGTGSYGTVWRARDLQTGAERALKVASRAGLDDRAFAHLVHEVKATLQLRHPNIVATCDIGQDEGWYYIASELVPGRNLADWKNVRNRKFRECVAICIPLAEALHFAHEQGIVHRDLKPSNVMVDESDNPHLIDFGLAKRETDESRAAERYRRAHYLLQQPKQARGHRSGPVLGTPAYMSPEQAMGNAHLVDRRTDIYALGVMLYELVTGRRPFNNTTEDRVIRQIIRGNPPRPRRFNCNIPQELENVCLKAMANFPAQRFRTAQEMADVCRSIMPQVAQADLLPVKTGSFEWLWNWLRLFSYDRGSSVTTSQTASC